MNRPWYVYIARRRSKDSAAKIGISTSPFHRATILRFATKEECWIVKLFLFQTRAEAQRIETGIKEQFARLSLGKEWFKMKPQTMTNAIRKIMGHADILEVK